MNYPGFTEVTYVNPSDRDEVMVHVTPDGRVLDAYVYRDSPLIRFNPEELETDETTREQLSGYNWRWRKGKNPLFVHVGVANRTEFVNWIGCLGYVASAEESMEYHRMAQAISGVLLEDFSTSRDRFISQGNDPGEVDSALNTFKELKSRNMLRGEQGDIDRYKDFGTLRQVIQQMSSVKSRGDVEREDKSGAIKIFENDQWVVYRITTWAASKLYGSGTRWCISSRNDDAQAWNAYSRKDKFFIIAKDPGSVDPLYRKIAVVGNLADAKSNKVSPEEMEHQWQEFAPQMREYFHTNSQMIQGAKTMGMTPDQFFNSRAAEIRAHFVKRYGSVQGYDTNDKIMDMAAVTKITGITIQNFK